MAVVLFDNYKFTNTGGPISPMQWGAFTGAGANNVTNTYASNGYSANGLDLSVTAASATHGSNYASINNISVSNGTMIASPTSTGRVVAGVSVTSYQQSGAITQEPQLASDMTKFVNVNTVRTAFSGDGMHFVTLRYDTASATSLLELYVRTAAGANTYTLSGTIATYSGTANSGGHLVSFSPDGIYICVVVPKSASVSSGFVYQRSAIGSTTYTQVATFTPANAVNAMTFTAGNNIVYVVNVSPFVVFLQKTIGSNTWTAQTNPTTLPGSAPVYVATSASSNGIVNVVVTTGSSPFVYYYQWGSGQPTYVSTAYITGLPGQPQAVDINGSGVLALGFSASPYFKAYSTNNAAVMTTQPTVSSGLYTVKFSYDGCFLILGYSSAVQPTMYKVIYNGTSTTFTALTTSLPAVTVYPNSCSYSADDNYFSFTTNTPANDNYIATFDQQINVPLVISGSSSNASNLADNYAYSGGPFRLSLTIQDEMLGLRYYSNNTGAVCTFPGSVPASQCGLTSSFTGAYLELYAQNVNGTQASVVPRLNGNVFYRASADLYVFGLAGFGTLIPSGPDMNSFLSGPLAVTFKRDINTTSSTTVNSTFSDFYLLDGSGLYNNSPLGACAVVTESLTSDNSKTWNSSTGTTSYQIVGNNPPNPAQYVSASTSGATDLINVDNTLYTYANAFASKINIKAQLNQAGTVGVKVIDQDVVGPKNSLTTSFADYNFYTDLRSYYIAAGTTSNGLDIRKLNTKTNTLTSLTINGLASNAAISSIAMTPDASIIAVSSTTITNKVGILTKSNDVYTLSTPSAFSNLTTQPTFGTASNFMEFSPNGVYLAIVWNSNQSLSIYKNVNGVITFLTTFTNANSFSGLKFSKGGKYLFAISVNSGGTQVYSINSSTDAFTLLSGTLSTAVGRAVDTTITADGLTEYVIIQNNATPYLYMNKINNDNTFTAATITSQTNFGSVFAGGIAFVKQSTNTQNVIGIVMSMNGATNNTFYAQYNISTNTVANATSTGTQLAPTPYYVRALGAGGGNLGTSGLTVAIANGTAVYYTYAPGGTGGSYSNGTISTYNLASNNTTYFQVGEEFLNSTIVGYQFAP